MKGMILIYLDQTVKCPHCKKQTDVYVKVDSPYVNNVTYCDNCEGLILVKGFVQLVIDKVEKMNH